LLIKGATEIYYPGYPHGLTATHADRVNSDLLAFLRGQPVGVPVRELSAAAASRG
jgi:hypothetical protein